MNKGKYVFAQIVEFLPQRIFDGIVENIQGTRRFIVSHAGTRCYA